MFGNIRLSSIFSIIELCRSMGQHFREHFCEGGYPHLTEEYMIRRHIHSKWTKMFRRSTSLLSANASTAVAVEAASQVVKSQELSPSESVWNVVVEQSDCQCPKTINTAFGKNAILRWYLNINVKCHINVEHEGNPWCIPLDFSWDGSMLPGDTRIH